MTDYSDGPKIQIQSRFPAIVGKRLFLCLAGGQIQIHGDQRYRFFEHPLDVSVLAIVILSDFSAINSKPVGGNGVPTKDRQKLPIFDIVTVTKLMVTSVLKNCLSLNLLFSACRTRIWQFPSRLV